MGSDWGKHPISVQLEEGTRSLRIEADKFKPYETEFSVTAQQDIDLGSIELEPADAVLKLTSTPTQAAVLVNGEYLGTSPLQLTISPDEDHGLEVFKAGHLLSRTKLRYEPGAVSESHVALKQDRVNVSFSISPTDAELIIDGKSFGKGSRTVALNTLPHNVRVTRNGYASYQNQIIPTRGNSQVVSVDLLTNEQSYWANIPTRYTTRAGQQMKLFKSPGTVKMGSSRRETGRRSNETMYTAELKKHFYVSLHEVSNQQFRAFQPGHSSGNYKRKSLDANKQPVANVSWQKAAQYCNWLSKQEGLNAFYKTKEGYVSGYNVSANGYRLLTEVEWAWLARNDDGQPLTYPWGSSSTPTSGKPVENLADMQAVETIAFTLPNYDDGYQASSPIGRFPANGKGLYDIGGNVAEWTNDWYSSNSDYGVNPPTGLTDPLGPEVGEFHVIRGGSWARGHLLRYAWPIEILAQKACEMWVLE